MSSSEVTISGAVGMSGMYSHQNGDLQSSSNNGPDKTSALPNPFYKNFGRSRNSVASSTNTAVLDRRRNYENDSDDIGEYRPGSGFVNKLRNRFASINAREDTTFTPSYLKKASSLEDISVKNKTKDESSIQSPTDPDAKSAELNKPLSSTSKTSKSIKVRISSSIAAIKPPV